MGLLSKWTDGEREAPEPLEGPVVGTIVTGTVVWLLLFLGQLPFYGWFEDHGHTWWVWTCAAGAGLGLLGIWIVRRREAALQRLAEQQEAGPGDADDGADGQAHAAGADRQNATGADREDATTGGRSGTGLKRRP